MVVYLPTSSSSSLIGCCCFSQVGIQLNLSLPDNLAWCNATLKSKTGPEPSLEATACSALPHTIAQPPALSLLFRQTAAVYGLQGGDHDFDGVMPVFVYHLDCLMMLLGATCKMSDWQKKCPAVKERMKAYMNTLLGVMEVCIAGVMVKATDVPRVDVQCRWRGRFCCSPRDPELFTGHF